MRKIEAVERPVADHPDGEAGAGAVARSPDDDFRVDTVLLGEVREKVILDWPARRRPGAAG